MGESFVISRDDQCHPRWRDENLPRCRVQSTHAILQILSPSGSRPVRSRRQRRPQQTPGVTGQHVGRFEGSALQTKSMAKSVLIATRIPRLFRTYSLSSEASQALVPQTGYSPPVPKSATPRATIIIQKSLQRLVSDCGPSLCIQHTQVEILHVPQWPARYRG